MQVKPVSFAASKFIAIALGVSIPVSVALDNLFLFLLAILFFPFGFREYWEECKTNPVARAVMLLFAALLAGVIYGDAALGAAFDTLGKYVDLAFIPLFLVIFRDEKIRRAALYVFLCVMTLALFLSVLLGNDLIPVATWMNRQSSGAEPTVFHGYIAHNHLMAFAAFLFFLKFMESRSFYARLAYALLAAIASYDVLFLVSARTGPLVLFSLLAYLGWTWAAKGLKPDLKKLGIALAATILAVLLTYQYSPKFRDRATLAAKEISEWDSQRPAGATNSMGLRMEYYYQTFQIIAEHPLSGVGTGGFATAYSGKAEPRGLVVIQNPHNEYLLIAAQIGLAGLALLIYLFYTMWKNALRMKNPFERNAGMGLVISTALVCLFNSPLLDHTEGLFFAFMSALFFTHPGSEERHV